MTIYSMTGFATHTLLMPQGQLRWEMRSVNHRFLEITFKMPENFKKFEFSLRKLLATKIKRGKIDCHLQPEGELFNSTNQTVNVALADNLMVAIRDLLDRYPILQPPVVTDILRWPALVTTAENDQTNIQAEIQNSFLETVDKLLFNRAEEGKILKEILLQRLKEMEARILKIKQRLPTLAAQLRSKILARLAEHKIEADAKRIEEELVYLLNKLDFTEELERLALHTRAAFSRLMQQPEVDTAVGKQLEFILQEMNRETNTLSSKANDAEIAELGIELKVLIEQLREQVQNLE